MKYLPLRDFDAISAALNFSTADSRVKGSCDLYTTKAAGSDKKLYKSIETSLEAQHAALIKLGASLSPPQRKEMAVSLNLSRSSPFGNLSEAQSRRTFAYLIATLNASHPDYDFSHVLRPRDFQSKKLNWVMANFDSTMNSVRPLGTSLLSPNGGSSYRAYSSSPAAHAAAGGDVISSHGWGPYMWTMLDQEMTLKDCIVYSFEPLEDPFDGDEAAIWRMHYLFFNKDRKRVAYLYVRGVPIIVNSPALAPNRRGSNGLSKRRATPLPGSLGANKRARYWLGDQLANRAVTDDDDDDYDNYDNYDEEEMTEYAKYAVYDSDMDVDIDPLNDPSTDDEESDECDDGDDDDDYDYDEESEDEVVAHSVRGLSEDIVASMEM